MGLPSDNFLHVAEAEPPRANSMAEVRSGVCAERLLYRRKVGAPVMAAGRKGKRLQSAKTTTQTANDRQTKLNITGFVSRYSMLRYSTS